MQYPESTSAVVEQAWLEPGSLKPRGGHHLEPQGFKGLFVRGATGFSFYLLHLRNALQTTWDDSVLAGYQAGERGLPCRFRKTTLLNGE